MEKPTRICTIDGCHRKHEARGYCALHYRRWRVHGDPFGGGRRYLDPETSLRQRTRRQGECLIWVGSVTDRGYGMIRANGKMRRAHRWVWEQSYGQIPPDVEVDHICHNRACVELSHLRTVTRAENMQNRSGATSANRSTGTRNVYRHSGGGYQVIIGKDGQYHHIGTYKEVPDAAKAAERARRELFGEFAGRG